MSEKINSASGTIAQSAKDFGENTKYSGQIRDCKRKVQTLYEEIGKCCYENRIGETDERVAPCGNVAEVDSIFCEQCGKKLK